MKPESKQAIYQGLLGAASMIVVLVFAAAAGFALIDIGRTMGHIDCALHSPRCK